MFSLSVWAVLLLLSTLLINIALPFAKNIRTAKATGIPYLLVPYYGYNRMTSMVMARTFLRLTDQFWPEIQKSPTSWRNLVTTHWPWKLRYAPFAALGTDTFLTVAPGGIILHTADATVTSQITSRGDDFPKAIHLYHHVDIFGKNVVSSGGATWRRHRAVTSPAFTDKNNQLVWRETLDITQAVLGLWTEVGADGKPKTIKTLGDDSMRLSLEVIGRAGLGQKLEWPKVSENRADANNIPPSGHEMTFTNAVRLVLGNMIIIMALPMWFLKNSPFKKLNRLSQAYTEWGIYMQEMIAAKKETIRNSSNESSSIDLIGQLLKGQQVGKVGKNAIDFTDSDVMGNLFMFIIAGHETSANSIHFSLLLLALHPSAQRKVQKELDEIFQGRSVLKWDYEHDTPLLLNSFLAAVLNEQLRLISPTLTVPKISAPTPQNLFVNGKEVTVPPNTMIRLCLPSIHRNPNFWPRDASKDASLEDDLEEFKPERWITADGMYTPVKGSYVPFSEGQRACLGKRFAQIEILAALAVILSGYSVELAVDEWATDNEIEAMSLEERREVWEKAKEKGTWVMRTKMTAMITLQLRGACVPVRFVKRGDERFSDI